MPVSLTIIGGPRLRHQDVTAETSLTIAGRAGEVNRGPCNSFEGAFFKYHQRPLLKAYAFNSEMLERLPQKPISAAPDGHAVASTAHDIAAKDWIVAIDTAGKRLKAQHDNPRVWSGDMILVE